MAKSDRTMLLVLFRPGLYITTVVVAGLILIHATIAVFLLLQVNAGISFAVAIGRPASSDSIQHFS